MGTDRWEHDEIECECGEGSIVLIVEEADHPYMSGQRGYRARLDCERCSQEYVIEGRQGDFKLVDRDEKEAQEELWEEYKREVERLREYEKVDELRERLKEKLGQLERESKAAVYRYLSSIGLYRRSQSTFYGDWTNPEHWVDDHTHHLHPDQISRLLEDFGEKDSAFHRELKEAMELNDRATRDLPVVRELDFDYVGDGL